MSVGAAEAEGIHGDQRSGPIRRRQRGQRSWNANSVQGQPRVGLFEMDAARQFPILQAEYGLDQAGDSRGRFKVSDVALD